MKLTKLVLTALLAIQGTQALAVDSATLLKAKIWMCQQDAKSDANCKQILAANASSSTSTSTTSHTSTATHNTPVATHVTPAVAPAIVTVVAPPAAVIPAVISAPIHNNTAIIEDAVDQGADDDDSATDAAILSPLHAEAHGTTAANVSTEAFVQKLISFDFMHTKQNCAVVEGNITHKSTYCTGDKMAEATELSGMVKRINEQLDTTLANPKGSKVSVAYFSFSNKGVQKKLCEIASKGVTIRIFLDGGSAGQADELLLNNPACLENGKSNVTMSYLGGQTNGGAGGVWRLHHNKFLMIDTGGPIVKLNFSSGNLSSFGTSLHLDHWVMTEAPRNSNLIKAQRCVMEGLESAATTAGVINTSDVVAADQEVAQAYIDTREACFDENNVIPRVSGGNIEAQIAKALEKEQIAPLFSPNNNSYVEKSLINAINKIPSGGYMYIAIQHFLHQGVAQSLIAASKKGVDVRIIMDDDALRGESEVPGVDQMILNLINQAPKMQIRLAETNHGAGGNGSMMHNKLAILNGNMTFSGAGHYTNAALRKNWENFYFVTNISTIKSYANYFQELWSQSVDIAYTQSKGATPSSAPSKLNAKFLDLLN